MVNEEKIGFGSLKLLQSEDSFKYGIDAVILADFADSLCHEAETVADLGTGNGIIPFIISHLNDRCRITGIEIQKHVLELAEQSCAINGLEDRITFINTDVKNIHGNCPELRGNFDVVVTNPPYVPKGGGIENINSAKYIARQETSAVMEDFIAAASYMLKEKGHLFMVHRPSRLVDIFCFCRKYRLEPKDVRLVVPRKGEKPNIVLVHCVLGGGKELRFHRELQVYSGDGSYSEEIEKIYHRG
ncbi:MAG: methyltransferase [Firmicutes bacterium]|nr:methyltransferase [Bacillota bacterium]